MAASHQMRLLPGAHLYEGCDGTWFHRDPEGVVRRLRGRSRELDALGTALHHGLDRDQVTDAAEQTLVDDLVDAGHLCRSVPPRRGRVLLADPVDDLDSVGQILADLLAHHEVARGEPTAAALRRADVLVTGAGWLPDEPWLAINALCAETGTPWHRYHLDGRRLVVGPIFLPGHTASYRDTRGRLLAAAHDADGLAAHWHALGDAERRPPTSWLTRGAGAVAAGLVAADIDAVLSRGSIPSAGFQLVYDPVTASLTRHPVLPLPPVWRAPSAGHGR